MNENSLVNIFTKFLLEVLFHFQGFTDLSLTPGEAFAVLRKYEARTGYTVDPRTTNFEDFSKSLRPEDFNLAGDVRHILLSSKK